MSKPPARFAVLNLVLALALAAAGWPWAGPRPVLADEIAATAAPPPPTETPAEPPASATPEPPSATPAATETGLAAETPIAAATAEVPPGETVTAVATSQPAASSTPGPDTATPAPVPTDLPSATATPTLTPLSSPTYSPTPTFAPTFAATASPTPSLSPTPTLGAPALASVGGTPSTSLVISQLYGGGGNAGAPYSHDFVELYNLGPAALSLGGWSVQYATAAGSAWSVIPLAGALPPGGFWLVALSSGGGAGAPLPAPDQAAALNLSASAGKLALVAGLAPLAGACPADPAVVDFVGYGSSASCAEGAPITGLGNSSAAVRAGLTDTNQNAGDFYTAPPSPRNSGLGGAVTPTASPAPSATAEAGPTASPTLTAPPTATAAPGLSPTPSATPTATRTPQPAFAGAVLINEVVTDPQQDWSGSGFAAPPGAGAVSASDEFVELLITADGLDLTGWQIGLLDGSDVSGDLSPAGAFQATRYLGLGTFTDTRAGDRLVLGNVRGSGTLNNAITLVLSDTQGALIDSVRLGGAAPDGNAAGPADEAVARRPDGADAWVKQAATPGGSNDLAPAPAATPAASPSISPTPTVTIAPTPTAAAHPAGAVLINEVAWAGTAASTSDEWIELFNPGGAPIPLAGWTLTDGGDLAVCLPAGLIIPPGGYLLLERTDDQTISDIPADVVYVGGLSNSGETLALRDAAGGVIDLVEGAAGWPAGAAAELASMERAGPGPDWRTHQGAATGRDADGWPLRGTPRGPNSALLPTPTPRPIPRTVLLNEFLPAPSAGGREFMEIYNAGPEAVDLGGWQLDDAAGGSAPFRLPAGTWLAPGETVVFFQDETGLALNNSGDTARLLTSDGQVADEWAYRADPGDDVSWARVPDGAGWVEQGAPSPGAGNGAQAVPPVRQSHKIENPPAALVPIGVFRTWPAGAWATLSGRVSVPAPLLGRRLIYLQDETGAIPVYLGRGDWPALEPGQVVTLLGYSRLRAGRLEFYSRNLYHVHIAAPDGGRVLPVPVQAVAAETAGQWVTLTGRVVKLEATAFWLEAGRGPVRVFFSSSTGLRRPKVARGDIWTVTGVVTDLTATKTRAAGYQIQPLYAPDVVPVRVRYRQPVIAAKPALEAAGPAPTEEPTALP